MVIPEWAIYESYFLQAVALHMGCCFVLATVYFIMKSSATFLVTEPAHVLGIFSAVEFMPVVFGYSFVRQHPENCSYWRAVLRGIITVPIGALLNAFGAVVLGAPVSIKYLKRTVAWSSLMSIFTFVPAGCVFGSSWDDWGRIFAHSRLSGCIDCMISLPAHGSILGAWFGAWPMPLDWERPWQEWPVSVSYGAITGYLLGTLASVICVYLFERKKCLKQE